MVNISCWILKAILLRTINYIYFHVNLYHYDVYIHTYPLSDPIEVEVTHTHKRRDKTIQLQEATWRIFSQEKHVEHVWRFPSFLMGEMEHFQPPPKESRGNLNLFCRVNSEDKLLQEEME